MAWTQLFPCSSPLNKTKHPKTYSTDNGKRALKAKKVDWLGTSGLKEIHLVNSWVLLYILLPTRLAAG